MPQLDNNGDLNSRNPLVERNRGTITDKPDFRRIFMK